MTTWHVRQIGSGEDVRVQVQADGREEAIKKAQEETRLPWFVRKVTARPAKKGDRDDRIELKWHS